MFLSFCSSFSDIRFTILSYIFFAVSLRWREVFSGLSKFYWICLIMLTVWIVILLLFLTLNTTFDFLNELLLMRPFNFPMGSKVIVTGPHHFDFVFNTNISKSFLNSSMLLLWKASIPPWKEYIRWSYFLIKLLILLFCARKMTKEWRIFSA